MSHTGQFQKGYDPRRHIGGRKGIPDRGPRMSLRKAIRDLYEQAIPPELQDVNLVSARGQKSYLEYLVKNAIVDGLKHPLTAFSYVNLIAKLFDEPDRQTGAGTSVVFVSNVQLGKLRANPMAQLKAKNDPDEGSL